jgi:hypothetical protein
MQMHHDVAMLIRNHEVTMERELQARAIYRQALAGRPGLLDRLKALFPHRERLTARPVHN